MSRIPNWDDTSSPTERLIRTTQCKEDKVLRERIEAVIEKYDYAVKDGGTNLVFWDVFRADIKRAMEEK